MSCCPFDPAAFGRHAAREFREELAENALAPVTIHDALIVHHAGRCGGNRALRHAGGDRVLLQLREKLIEALAVVTARTGLGSGGRREQTKGNEKGRGRTTEGGNRHRDHIKKEKRE